MKKIFENINDLERIIKNYEFEKSPFLDEEAEEITEIPIIEFLKENKK